MTSWFSDIGNVTFLANILGYRRLVGDSDTSVGLVGCGTTSSCIINGGVHVGDAGGVGLELLRLVDLHGAEYRRHENGGAHPVEFLAQLLRVGLPHLPDAPEVLGYDLLLRHFRQP